MPRFRLLRHFTPSGGSVVTPTVSYVSASGVKRQGEVVWLQVVDDGTANKYKFDVQVSGSSLTSVSIADTGGTSTTNFPFQTISSAISFIVPASLVGVAYTITGTASNNGGSPTPTYATPVAAAENFGLTAGTYFTPSTIVLNSVDRLTGSGVVPPEYRLNLSAGFYDSYLAEVHRKTVLGVSRGISYIYPQTNGTALVISTDPATDPAPSPPLPTANTDDVDHIAVVSGDWYDSNAAGVRSNIVICPIDDTVVGYRYVRLNVTDTNGSPVYGGREIELAATVGGTSILVSKTYTHSFRNGPSGGGNNFDSDNLFNGNVALLGVVGDNSTGGPTTLKWSAIDLGSVVPITTGWNLRIIAAAGFGSIHPKNYQLWLSNDPTFATKVVVLTITGETDDNSGGNHDHSVTVP